jgi:hypothetical protein
MIRTARISRTDISVREKYIVEIFERETESGEVTVVDIGTSNSLNRLVNWAHAHVLSHNPELNI